uniref:DUF2693 domain-containing protein n=1 Tax=Prevotella sp. GTC17254 TaxID=3236794 RepID=A0AB33IZL2_9BACT
MNNMLETLIQRLHQGIVSFAYKKKDGSKRFAQGTLYGIGHTIKDDRSHHHCSYTLAYYDIDCRGWRSFIIDNLIEVGELRRSTIAEHHEICLALVVKLKEKMRNEGNTAFAYRKADGSIRYAHGILTGRTDIFGKYFVYFDTDKWEERRFRIDSFIGIGEPSEIDEYNGFVSVGNRKTDTSGKAYNDFGGIDIKTILAHRGIYIEDIKNIMVIDLLPELGKEQLRDIICKAAERLANL